MSQQRLYEFVTALLPSWRKTRRTVLALGVGALVRRRRLTLTGMARGMESETRIRYRVKRLWRFVNNLAVDPREAVSALAVQACRLRPSGWLPLVMDETGLKDRVMLLGAAVAYHGRALPLALYPYVPERIKHSLWKLREGVLATALAQLEPTQRARVLLIADRGYAASRFFARLLCSQIAFVIRVPRRVLLHMAYGSQSLETLAADLRLGQRIFLRDVYYGPAHARLNVVLWWQPGQPEPWLLATTLPDADEACHYYRQRMGIEELFKDFKGRFALEACQLQTRDRIGRMCMFLLLALWALALLVRYPTSWRDWITVRGALSFVSLALEWLDSAPSQRRRLRAEAESG